MIDNYCERLDPGFWAEPLNALTNLAFLIAAVAAWRLAVRHNVLTTDIIVLIGLIAAVGIGSGAFHTFATLLSASERRLDTTSFLAPYRMSLSQM